LKNFRENLKKTFEEYCGVFVKVETIDEIEKREREFDF
jgi:translation initiation factor 2 beta subunit (eIF-2beta)/eIF-5